MAENPPDQCDDLLVAIERLANPATSLPNGKIAGTGFIAAAKKGSGAAANTDRRERRSLMLQGA
jgi:hypothetical protein